MSKKLRDLYIESTWGRASWEEVVRMLDEEIEELRRRGLVSPDPTSPPAAASPDAPRRPVE